MELLCKSESSALPAPMLNISLLYFMCMLYLMCIYVFFTVGTAYCFGCVVYGTGAIGFHLSILTSSLPLSPNLLQKANVTEPVVGAL